MNFCWDKPLLWFLDLLSMVTTLIAMQFTNFQEICNNLDAFYLQFLIMIIKYVIVVQEILDFVRLKD
jgi:hypothetical protein